MKQIFYPLFLLIPVLLVGTAPSAFADERTPKTEVGITFIEGNNIPNPNQALPYVMPRGQPTDQKRLPQTNDRTDDPLFWGGVALLMIGGSLSIKKERKKERETNRMNKLLITGTLLIGTSLGLAGMTQAVNADTTKTTSDITFTGGDLKIAQAPQALSFGTHEISSAEQTYQEVDKSGSSRDASLTVGDYRGQTTAGWTLTANLETADFGGMDLSINPKGATGTTDYTTFTNQKLNGDGQTIATVTADKMSKEKPDTQFGLGATLHIPANTLLSAKTYTNTIDWNLQSTPQ